MAELLPCAVEIVTAMEKPITHAQCLPVVERCAQCLPVVERFARCLPVVEHSLSILSLVFVPISGLQMIFPLMVLSLYLGVDGHSMVSLLAF